LKKRKLFEGKDYDVKRAKCEGEGHNQNRNSNENEIGVDMEGRKDDGKGMKTEAFPQTKENEGLWNGLETGMQKTEKEKGLMSFNELPKITEGKVLLNNASYYASDSDSSMFVKSDNAILDKNNNASRNKRPREDCLFYDTRKQGMDSLCKIIV
jgi:hypothetical protein